jgi:hypothetical protein|tara:strand:+ start:1352 stop:1672 length:321 start_codon:yes stop_codon:yes gene_type:complete
VGTASARVVVDVVLVVVTDVGGVVVLVVVDEVAAVVLDDVVVDVVPVVADVGGAVVLLVVADVGGAVVPAGPRLRIVGRSPALPHDARRTPRNTVRQASAGRICTS